MVRLCYRQIVITAFFVALYSPACFAGQWTGISVQGEVVRAYAVLDDSNHVVDGQLDVAVAGTGIVRYTCSLVNGIATDPDCGSAGLIENFCPNYTLQIAATQTTAGEPRTQILATCPANERGRCVAVGGYFIEDTAVSNHAAAKMYATSILPMSPSACQ